ncbi:outer membrane protein assembly factor [Noviherbaspirillum cavernae]|uniref:Outer membrane protein assembly factor n=1 Tax=Noviherbaspirillum cavernae TaxID=2320862 RepID=A0A418X635_9BURK|nr:autotransporter assembly complex family protein [Noviherbaspirillum cavernae]RJG07952.1 outer membrane protein assembly factor [Noviherbaspirillum cavernae]
MQCTWLACWLALFVLSVPVSAQTVHGYTVEIVGAESLSELLDEHLEIRRHRDDADLSEQELRRLVDITPQQIRELLATEGYFSPVVEEELDMTGSRPVARFRVQQGEPTRVGSVEIRFSGNIANEAHTQRVNRLRRQWSLDSGEVFKQSDWSDAKNALLKNMLVRDYPTATITASEARVDPERRMADLSVEIDSGPAVTFGELQVEGLSRYSRQMIDELNPIRSGERYSQEKLNELQARLQDTGYFRSVFISVNADREHPDNVPIQVDLNENPLKRLSFGIGFSTDAGLRLEARWLHRNFLDRQWRLDSELLWDGKTRRAGIGLFLPALRNGWRPSYDARYERKDISGELTDEIRFGARVTSPSRTDEKSWGVAYLADRQHVGSTVNNRQALMGSFAYTRRRVDNLISPRRGYVATVTLGGGPAGIGNEVNFGRVTGKATWLSPYYKRWQAVLRGQVGQVFGASRFDLPGDLLFRTGGDQTVRGYAFESLGVAQNGAVVGGTVMAVMSAELVYNITQQWGAAVFVDAGNASDSWRGFDLRRGTGVGARWRSPIGPVNLDLAYGEATREVRLHFTVGYGF